MADDFDIFERAETDERRARAEAARKDHEAFEQYERDQAALRKIAADATTRRSNESALLGEYRRAGVQPPFTNGAGIPTVSLSMLSRMGWKIEVLDGEMRLVR